MVNDAPIRSKQEAVDVLDNIIEGLAITDAYHEGDTELLLCMMREDILRYLIGQMFMEEST